MHGGDAYVAVRIAVDQMAIVGGQVGNSVGPLHPVGPLGSLNNAEHRREVRFAYEPSKLEPINKLGVRHLDLFADHLSKLPTEGLWSGRIRA